MNATCIPETDLAQFVHGQLASERRDQIAEHVDACESCQDTVVALADNEDTFVTDLRAAQADGPFEGEAALNHGLRRMVASMRQSKSPSGDQTSAYVRQVGPYVLAESLGTGGMGMVYRAVHSKLKRDVAVKLLPAARWSNAAAISRFEREMEAIGQLDHPNIVRASDAGEDQGMHYLVMDYVDGLDLSRLTARLGPLPVADACELARQAAQGLQYAHDNGLVHRDVKPSNLMLAQNNGRTGEQAATLRVLDLGLALLGDEHLQDAGELTSVGQLMGTLDYMSPEQGIDSHGVDHRTDIYGLGATLFKLLTGRAPYADPRFGTLMKKMTALATKNAPSVAEFRDDLPAELVSIVDRMLARDPDERFPSAAQVADALAPLAATSNLTALLQRGIETDDPTETRPVVLAPSRSGMDAQNTTTAPPMAPSTDPTIAPSASAAGGSGGKKWWIALASAGALILAGIAVYIDTNVGNVHVHCDDPNATVSVKRASGESTSIRIEKGEGVQTVRAGKYIVEVAGDAVSYKIEPREFDLKRKKLAEVSVTTTSPVKAAAATNPFAPDAGRGGGHGEGVGAPAMDPPGQKGDPDDGDAKTYRLSVPDRDPFGSKSEGMDGDPFGDERDPTADTTRTGDNPFDFENDSKFGNAGSDAPTYGGMNFAQWARQARTSRDTEGLARAFDAMPVLADNAEMQKTTAELICKSMRVHGGVHFKRKSGVFTLGKRHALVSSCVTALLRLGPDATIDVLAREATEGNVRSKEFVRMMTTLELPEHLDPDRNEVCRFRAGLVKNRDKFPADLVPEAIPVLIRIDDAGIRFDDDMEKTLGSWVSNDISELADQIDNTWRAINTERWVTHIVVIGERGSTDKPLLDVLKQITQQVRVTKIPISKLEIYKEGFNDRLRRTTMIVDEIDDSPPQDILGPDVYKIHELPLKIVCREAQYKSRVQENSGQEDEVSLKWQEEITRWRKEASQLEKNLESKFEIILADDFDAQKLKALVNTTRLEQPGDTGQPNGADTVPHVENREDAEKQPNDLNKEAR